MGMFIIDNKGQFGRRRDLLTKMSGMQWVLILIERVCQRRTFCKVVFNYVATTSQLANTNIFKQLNIQVGCSTATQWAIGPCNC